jgi:hypothetical protein
MFMKPPCDEAVIRSASADAPCAAKVGPWILAAAVLGSSMAFVDSTVVNGRFLPRGAYLLGHGLAIDEQGVFRSQSKSTVSLLIVK